MFISKAVYEDLLERASAYNILVANVSFAQKAYYCENVVMTSLGNARRCMEQWKENGRGLAQEDIDKLNERIKELENELLEERQKRLVLAGIVKENKG